MSRFLKIFGKRFVLRLFAVLFLILLLPAAGPVFADPAEVPHEYRIAPVPFTQANIPSGFWKSRIDTAREETIPFSFKKCEENGRVRNFMRAAGTLEGKFEGICCWDDSDVYKVLEGASFLLAIQEDPKLDAYMDDIIAKIAAAQETDGYLYTMRTIYQNAETKDGQVAPPGGLERWSNTGGHELYCLGHLYEAAYAHHLATGKRNLLDIALKSADFICETFGDGKSQNWPPGHQEVEMGLVKLYRLTGEKKYLDLAKHFLDLRGRTEGRTYAPYGPYSQDHKPVVEQDEAVGHAVRACYMYSGIADVAALTGDKAYKEAILRIWKNVVEKKLYVTGGVGARRRGESFGDAYELPNDAAYCETCAQIAAVYWAHRMFLDSGKAEYCDVMEKIMYNALISGISLDGKSFFYPNPLEIPNGDHKRSPWFGCSCCPSNLCRFMPSVSGYLYAVEGDTVYVNLYSNSSVTLDAKVSGQPAKVTLEQKTNYPWDGKIAVSAKTAGRYTLKFRIPAWVRGEAVADGSKLYSFVDPQLPKWTVSVNGTPVDTAKLEDGYLTITRDWKDGDAVDLDFPMTIQRVIADERIVADRGKVALQRGPIVFCVEQQDVNTKSLYSLRLDDSAKISEKWEPELLGGVMTLTGTACEYYMAPTKNDPKTMQVTQRPVSFRAIPYYAWAHREARQMAVWLNREESAVQPLTFLRSIETRGSEGTKHLDLMGDGGVPTDKTRFFPGMHWWPKLGTAEWAEYHFPETMEVEKVRIFWFDDRGFGHCRVPESWRLLYLDTEGKWQPVEGPSGFGTEYFIFNETTFKPVKTKGLRVEMQSQKGWAGGIYEWDVE